MAPSDLPILDELGREFSKASRRQAPQPSPRRRAPRTRRLLTAAAILLVTAATAGTLANDGTGPSLAERAYAAVAPPEDGIRHVVSEETIFRRDGRELRQRQELWISADGCRARMRHQRPPGRLAGEITQDRNGTRTYLPEEERILVGPPSERYFILDPVASFRDLYRRGKVRETGRQRLNGHDVIRFTMTDNDLTAIYFADADTFVPREMWLRVDGRRGYRNRVLVYETLPASAAEQVLTMPERPGVEIERRDPVDEPPTASRQQPCLP